MIPVFTLFLGNPYDDELKGDETSKEEEIGGHWGKEAKRKIYKNI